MIKKLLKIKKHNFIIRFSDGKNFAKRSKDFNPIHINKIYGYNSMFGQNIVHGVLIVIFFLNRVVISKEYNIDEINIKFLKHAEYDKKLSISNSTCKKQIFFFSIFQNNQLVCEIKIRLSKLKGLISSSQKKTLEIILKKISWYAGMKHPGINSLLYDIAITLKENKKSKKFKVKSFNPDKRIPLIHNIANYKNYKINFISLVRPHVKNISGKPSLLIKKYVQNLKQNILIIGASQGIGKDLLKLVKKNEKIKIIATYFRNKIRVKEKKIIVKKIDITKNFDYLKKLIKNYSPVNIYYFASPKILFDKNISKEKMKEFKDFFINYPLKILNQNKNYISSFFYPSTDFINFDKNAPYSMIKSKAEKKIKRFCSGKKINFLFHRFPAINSRQSVSISNTKSQDLISYLNKNKQIINKILL